jgi:hypothetical protein
MSDGIEWSNVDDIHVNLSETEAVQLLIGMRYGDYASGILDHQRTRIPGVWGTYANDVLTFQVRYSITRQVFDIRKIYR